MSWRWVKSLRLRTAPYGARCFCPNSIAIFMTTSTRVFFVWPIALSFLISFSNERKEGFYRASGGYSVENMPALGHPELVEGSDSKD
jgi:ABC-type spermidine/putrescine transport system permease subunit II